MGIIKARKDQDNAKMASKASDMQQHLAKVSAEKDLDRKKLFAIEMSKYFTVGGKEKFVDSITNAKTAIDVDRISFNAVLKGEGLSSKRFI